MLIIRMQRVGKKKFSTYRLIISEKARDTQGTYLEALGTYNPHAKENSFLPNIERIKFWLSKGAMVSDTLHNLLVANKIIEGKKKKSVFLSKARQTKLAEKKKVSAEAQAKAEADKAAKAEAEKAAKAEAEAQAKAAVEAPAPVVEETPVEAPAETPVETPTETPTETPAAQA